MFKTTLSTALFALAAITAPVHASARAETTVAPQRVVDASDLDLTTADGKATFDRRLAAAVKVVCAADEPSDLPGRWRSAPAAAMPGKPWSRSATR